MVQKNEKGYYRKVEVEVEKKTIRKSTGAWFNVKTFVEKFLQYLNSISQKKMGIFFLLLLFVLFVWLMQINAMVLP